MQEQGDTSAGLVADSASFFWRGGLGEENCRTARSVRSDQNLSLITALAVFGGPVFDQVEAEGLREEGDGFVVVSDDQGHVAYGLGHLFSLLPWCTVHQFIPG
jgi:hypothetical protein